MHEKSFLSHKCCSKCTESNLINSYKLHQIRELNIMRDGEKLIVVMLLFQSTIFTGRPGYVIAALWLIGGIIFVGALLISKIFFAKGNTGYGDMNYFLARFHICSMIIFILLAAFVM